MRQNPENRFRSRAILSWPQQLIWEAHPFWSSGELFSAENAFFVTFFHNHDRIII